MIKLLLTCDKLKINFLNNILIQLFQWSFIFRFINKTALFLAIEKRYTEIIKLLLNHNKIDVNIQCILI